MKPRERMLAVLNGEVPDQVPTGELGVDYPITEYVLGRRTYYRAKYREKSALWAGKRDEVVASQKRDLVDLAQTLKWDWLPVFLTYRAGHDYAPASFIDETTWKDGYNRTWKYSPITEDILCVEMPPPDDTSIEVLREPFSPDESELELVRHVVKTLGDSHFIVGRTAIELRDAAPVMGRGPVDGTIPEAYGGLMMDMVDFSLRLIDDPKFTKRLLAAATDRAIEVALSLVEAGVEAEQKATARVLWHRFGVTMSWLVGLLVGIYLLGFIAAGLIFSFLYVKTHGRSWFRSAVYAAGLTALFYGVFVFGLGAQLHRGLLFSLF